MAHEIPGFSPGGYDVDADLSAKQFYCVKQSTTANRLSLCDTDGEIFVGVLQNKPNAAGGAATVMMSGITKLVAAETLAPGDFWGTDSAGKAKKVESTITGADVGDYIGGVIKEGGAVNELVTGTIGIQTAIVEAQ